MATFTCPPGTICTNQAGDLVGGRLTKDSRGVVKRDPANPGTKIYYATSTKVNQDTSGQVTGGTTDVYIIKNGEFVKAASTSDGGKSFTYVKDSSGNFIAGDDLRKDLSDQNSNINKNIDAQLAKKFDADPALKPAKPKLVDGTKNNAQDQGTGDQQGGSTPTQEPVKVENVQQREQFDQKLTYPIDLDTRYQDYIKLTMVEYVPRGLSAGTGTQSGAIPSRSNQVGDRKILSNIILPIPGGISDSNTLNWTSDEIDAFSAAGADILGSAIAEGESGAVPAAERAANQVRQNTAAVQAAATSSIVKSVTGVNRLQREQGAILNNSMELLFNGPQLRSFNFTFRLSPRSRQESDMVLRIIRTLKQGMSAKKANNFLFIKTPYTFFLGYYKNQDLHPYLNKFKECALTGMSMAYTPDGNYATFYDGGMTSYQMTLTFQELEPVFDSDYGDDYSNIGY